MRYSHPGKGSQSVILDALDLPLMLRGLGWELHPRRRPLPRPRSRTNLGHLGGLMLDSALARHHPYRIARHKILITKQESRDSQRPIQQSRHQHRNGQER